MNISVIIPTYNASKYLTSLLDKLCSQSIYPHMEIIVVDSSSTDETVSIAQKFDIKVFIIPKEEFDHGGTRSKIGKLSSGEILVYLTQDALPYDNFTIEKLIKPFYKNPKIGAAFGRQIPYNYATPFAKHLRLFNYPSYSYIREFKDKDIYGSRVAFCSNSFAAYRRSALENIGWFKEKLIVSEDSYAVAKMLLNGYKVAYIAEAVVYHSHNYTLLQEFKRYFDIGVFHRNEKWIIDTFGKVTDQGKRYILSEIKFLLKNNYYHLLPEFITRTILKYLGYNLGYHYLLLPQIVVKKLSLQKKWWVKNK